MSLGQTQRLLTGRDAFSALSDSPRGIVLGERRKGFFSIVEPVDETVNLIKNPSFKMGEYPYNSLTSNIQKTSTHYYTLDALSSVSNPDIPEVYPMHGGHLQLEPVDGSECSIMYSVDEDDVTDGEQYTFSCFVCGPPNFVFSVHVEGYSWGGASVEITERKKMRGTGGWQRLHVTFEVDTSSHDRWDLYLTREHTTQNPTDKFWTSMWVCEDNPFLTLPFNGSYQEKNRIFGGREYYSWSSGHEWNGKSVRSDKACSSGRERFLQDYGFILTEIVGLGDSGIEHVLQPISSGGSVWNTTRVSSRDFMLKGVIQGKTLQERMENEGSLARFLKSTSKRSIEQPTTMLFRVIDEQDNNVVVGQPLYIYCRYNGGISSSIPNENGNYDVNLSFTLVDPYIYSSMHKGFFLEPKVEFTSVYPHILMKRNEKNTWSKATDVNPVGGVIKKITRGKNGDMYLGGTFTSNVGFHGGEAGNVGYFIRYDEDEDDVIHVADFGTAAGATPGVYDILPLADGRIVFAGWFSDVDAAANSHNIAMNSPLDTVNFITGLNHPNDRFKINSMDINQKGIIFVVGEEVDGGTNYVYSYDTNTGTWDTVGTLNSGSVVPAALLSGEKILVVNRKIDSEFAVSDLYVSGRFETIDSVVGTGGLAKYNGETETWESLGDGIASLETATLITESGDTIVTESGDTIAIYIASGFVQDMVVGKDGKIYMVGNFSGTTGSGAGADPSDVNILSPYVIRYNGHSFEAVGLPGNYSEQTDGATKIDVDNKGRIHVLVSYNYSEDSVTLAKDYFVLDGNTWRTGGIYTAPTDYGVRADGDLYYDETKDQIWISSPPESGKITHGGEVTPVENNGEIVYPRITFVGANQIMSVYNRTTDKIIEFSNYVLQNGEIVTYDLEYYGYDIMKLISNVKGNISGMIKPSSNIGFGFVNGKNRVGYVYNFEGENASCKIEWREKYLGIYDSINYKTVKAV